MKQINSWTKKFVTIYTGQAFSILGSEAVQFAIVWWLTIQTESAVTLAVASIVACLPKLFLGPFAGVWVDRINRRTVLIASDGLVALSSAALGLAFLFNPAPPIAFIYVILCVRGIGGAFHNPAMRAAIPMFVPADMLTKAGGWGNLISSFSTMLGPVIGASLITLLPMAGVMLIDIAGAAFAIVCLLFVSLPDIKRSAEKLHFREDMRQGFQAIRGNKPLVAVGVPIVLASLIYMPLESLFPLLIRTHYAGTAWHNSIALAAFAGGLILSSLLIGIWGGAKKRFLLISLAMTLSGAFISTCGILPAGGASLWPFIVFVVCTLIMGSSYTFFMVPLQAYI
jgi:DHA3 family macrolide efflux protein-like MFS transporter